MEGGRSDVDDRFTTRRKRDLPAPGCAIATMANGVRGSFSGALGAGGGLATANGAAAQPQSDVERWCTATLRPSGRYTLSRSATSGLTCSRAATSTRAPVPRRSLSNGGATKSARRDCQAARFPDERRQATPSRLPTRLKLVEAPQQSVGPRAASKERHASALQYEACLSRHIESNEQRDGRGLRQGNVIYGPVFDGSATLAWGGLIA
jgi:hypothetical protein